MRACVTGGAGFIGSHVARALLARGDDVTVIDNLLTGSLANLDGVLDDIRFVRMDLSRPDPDLPEVLRGADCVFHVAALPSVARSVEDPLTSHANNATSTLVLLQGMRDAGVSRIVYSSSRTVYGNRPELPWTTHVTPQPASPYAAAKLAGEHYLEVFHQLYGLTAISLRYFDTYGPRQPTDSAYAADIPRFLEALRLGRPPLVFGDGTQTRDYVHVSDVVAASLRAASCSERLAVLNVASGRPTSTLDLLGILKSLQPAMPPPQFEPAHQPAVTHSWGDTGETQRVLGLKPGVTLEDGLRALLSGT